MRWGRRELLHTRRDPVVQMLEAHLNFCQSDTVLEAASEARTAHGGPMIISRPEAAAMHVGTPVVVVVNGAATSAFEQPRPRECRVDVLLCFGIGAGGAPHFGKSVRASQPHAPGGIRGRRRDADAGLHWHREHEQRRHAKSTDHCVSSQLAGRAYRTKTAPRIRINSVSYASEDSLITLYCLAVV